MNKQTLTESFIIVDKIDRVSSVDTRLIKNHILSNFTLDARYNDDQYWYMKDYVNHTFLKVIFHCNIIHKLALESRSFLLSKRS